MDFSSLSTSEIASGSDFFDKLADFTYGKGFKKDTKKIAYAIAGLIKDHQIVEFMPNMKAWPKNFNLAQFSEKKFKIETIVLNDMEAAIKGMAYLLSATKPFWEITWSSGIGGRYWDGNKIISPSGPICSCGKGGHVEALISGKAIEADLKAKFQLKNPLMLLLTCANRQAWLRGQDSNLQPTG